jgi:hypothetical protein
VSLLLIWFSCLVRLVEGVVCSSYFWRFCHFDVLHATHMVFTILVVSFFFITILVGEVHHDYSHFLVVPLSKHNIISFFPLLIQWFTSWFNHSMFLNTIYIAITMIVIFPLLVTRVPLQFPYFKMLIALLPIILVILAPTCRYSLLMCLQLFGFWCGVHCCLNHASGPLEFFIIVVLSLLLL